jgi:phage terminase small subunit
MNNPLKQIIEDVAFYTSGQDVVDTISPKQLKKLDEAISEADKGETLSWDEFKKEMNEWRKP